MGYHRAGMEVTGVDIAKQPRYPFAYTEWIGREFLNIANVAEAALCEHGNLRAFCGEPCGLPSSK